MLRHSGNRARGVTAAAATREERGEGGDRERRCRSLRLHGAEPHEIDPEVVVTVTLTACVCPFVSCTVIVAVPAAVGVTVKVLPFCEIVAIVGLSIVALNVPV